ncbi:MAG: phosphoribosylformylglycinamidine cyclo-ligase [Myxococcales bacterium]|nr:MAG: phosphoribosylformylglycinamidine cyclo-ligase [Myxococcales bacterium]
MSGLDYSKAGVSIDAGNAFIDRIKKHVHSTRTPHVLSSVGGFAGLMSLPKGLNDPVLVSGTDGVGTKLKLAFELNNNSSIGIDLVAMCVNDVLTVGASPLFFLDYFATGKLQIDQAEAVVSGIAQGCREADCALIGGETAELPGFYQGGEYDLAGFCVGIVERARILNSESINENHVIIALPSTGLHSNGYALARAALFETKAFKLEDKPSELDEPLASALLRPTKIYVKALKPLLAEQLIDGLCHVTGGGIVENLPRILPEGYAAEIDTEAWSRPAIFELIARSGQISEDEMRRVFNLGVGMILLVESKKLSRVKTLLDTQDETYFELGKVIKSEHGARVVFR